MTAVRRPRWSRTAIVSATAADDDDNGRDVLRCRIVLLTTVQLSQHVARSLLDRSA